MNQTVIPLLTLLSLLMGSPSLAIEGLQGPKSTPTVNLPSESLELVDSQTLFLSGTGGTHTYRIPAILTAKNGDLIAACDARRKSAADLKPQRTIDIVFRRSSDNGKTWTPIELLEQIEDGGCSDPSLLLNSNTGDIFCFYNYMVRDIKNGEFRFFVQKSTDHGKTWGKPVDFTDQVAGPELKNSFKFVTSGRGIQTRDGILLHNFVRVGQGVTLFGSRDQGETWKPFGEVSPGDESKLVQLPDDSWMVNSRLEPGKRFVHRSTDGGQTWKSAPDLTLPDPKCNACIIQYTSKRDGFDKNRLVFCNAASVDGRKNLAARISYDGGQSWSAGKVIDGGPASYSEITVLQDGSLGVLYEPGHSEIRFVRFTLEALTGGADKLVRP
jgi:sialidase-1